MYPFVTHAFNFVGRGALGILRGWRRRPEELIRGRETSDDIPALPSPPAASACAIAPPAPGARRLPAPHHARA